MWQELFDTSEKLMGIIAALAAALGAGTIPITKWFWRRHKQQQAEGLNNTNTNTTTITVGQDVLQLQLQRIENSIEHIETMLIIEGQVHQTQSTHLDGVKGEIAKLRNDIVELRIRMGRIT